jgi:C-terminal processing protease CtpA/Prc
MLWTFVKGIQQLVAMECGLCVMRHAGAPSDSKLGYVRLATFNSNTTAAAQEALYDLQKQGVAGLVLDIRNNGGGLFPAGVSGLACWTGPACDWLKRRFTSEVGW